MAQKPSLPKGARDFSSVDVLKRQYIMDVIKSAFKTFGFQPIETPSFENSSTLMGKYGEEGDRLIFKILNSGDYLKKANAAALEARDSNALTGSISEKALRYDLTVPFARYVVQHQNELTFPFKRYQMQPVWRADRPQKGRFREFWQCDADVVGSDSLLQEVAFVQLYDTVFNALGLEGVTIHINNRKILSGMAEVMGAQDKLIDFTVALDKLDKIGEAKVVEEMLSKGISQAGIDQLKPIFSLSGDFESQISQLENIIRSSEEGMKGIQELQFINQAISAVGMQTATLNLNVTLARGLNYYTGAIFEVAAPEGVQIGSIGGGGRYDDLTGIFGLKGMSGVGISFGLDRIYLVLEELDLFPDTVANALDVLFVNFGEAEALYALQAIKSLRTEGISCELYPDAAKLKKQLNYANKRGVRFVIMAGDQEIAHQTYTIKDMVAGTQETLSLEGFLELFN